MEWKQNWVRRMRVCWCPDGGTEWNDRYICRKEREEEAGRTSWLTMVHLEKEKGSYSPTWPAKPFYYIEKSIKMIVHYMNEWWYQQGSRHSRYMIVFLPFCKVKWPCSAHLCDDSVVNTDTLPPRWAQTLLAETDRLLDFLHLYFTGIYAEIEFEYALQNKLQNRRNQTLC